MVGTDILAENLERIALNLMLPITNFCGPISNQASVTLKIDAVSMYGKLLQAFEDMMLPYAAPILKFIVEQFELHASIVNGTASVDPFEAMVLRELYSEFISQSVDVCCSMVLISPHKLGEFAQTLFERCARTMKIVTDINAKYEIIELLAQLCLLALKSGEEQTPEEDFLDFEMRRIQAEDTELQELRNASSASSASSSTSSTAATLEQAIASYQAKLSAPIWTFKGTSFENFHAALVECVNIFETEEYAAEPGEDDDESDDEEEESEFNSSAPATPSDAPATPSDAPTASSSAATASSSTSSAPISAATSAPSFEVQKESPSKKIDKDAGEDSEGPKRAQDESGAATVIALMAGVSFKYFTAEEHATCFQLVHDALMKKIVNAFASSESYKRLPPMLDAFGQFLGGVSPALIAPKYQELTTLFEDIMKQVRIWKSEDPSPMRRRVYGAIRSELLPAYSALIRQDPASLLGQTEHFMSAVNFLLADPMVLAEFGSALVTISDEAKRTEAKQILKDGLLFRIVDTYLRELSNPEASTGMKKVVMQSLGRLAMGTENLFAAMLPVTVPVLLFLGQQTPDLAPAAITASAQLVYAVRGDKESVKPYLVKAVDQAIAMVLQDIIMSGFELSSTAQKATSSEISFNFTTKSQPKDDEEDEEDEEDEDEMMQDDNLADLVYKGECFLAFILHVPEFVQILESIDNGAVFERIFTTLLEIEEKPALFEEDSMLKMTAVDILLFMVENIKRTHNKAHREKAVNAMKESGVEHFEEELDEAIARLNRIKF